MKKKSHSHGNKPRVDTGVTTGKRLRWIRSKEYKLADDATLHKILNPEPPPRPEFKPNEYIHGAVNDSRLLYKCHEPGCGELFTSELSLRLHSNKHLNPNLRCTFCRRLSRTEDELSQHCEEFHPDLEKYPDADPLKCKKCNRVTRDVRALWRHIRETHQEKIYPCPYCEFPFQRPENLKSHLKLKHFSELGEKEPPKFVCKTCGKEFLYQNSMVTHIKSVHRGKTKRFNCKICVSSYLSKQGYNFHLKQHINPTTYPCHICNIQFKTKSKLDRHVKETIRHRIKAGLAKRNGEAPIDTNVPVIKTIKTINPNLTNEQLIDLCKTTVIKIILHRVDAFVVRPMPVKRVKTGDYLNCVYCEKTLPNLEAVKSHELICYMKIRNKKVHICPVCDKEFPDALRLKNHSRRHVDETPFKCRFCDAKFKNESAKRLHEKTRHFGFYQPCKPKYVACDDCGKVYRGIKSLKHHKDAVHLGIRIICKDCGKIFRRGDHFRKHLRIDHGKCPVRLECKHCNRSYVNKQTYLAHLLKPRHIRKIKEFEKNVRKEKNCKERTIICVNVK